jgi:hypothetical protein
MILEEYSFWSTVFTQQNIITLIAQNNNTNLVAYLNISYQRFTETQIHCADIIV